MKLTGSGDSLQRPGFRQFRCDAVVTRQLRVQERVIGEQHFIQRAILSHDEVEQLDSFVVHRLPQRVREIRELFRINAAVLMEAIEAEPLSKEFGGEASRVLMTHQTPHLTDQLIRSR